MKHSYIKTAWIIIMGLCLTGCASFIPTVSQSKLNADYVKKDVAAAQLAAVTNQYHTSLDANLNAVSTAKQKVIDGQGSQMQAAANSLYAIEQAAPNYPDPGAIKFTTDNAIEGFTALGVSPTVQAIMDSQTRLTTYITNYKSGNQAAIAQLQAEHDELVKQNGILVATTQAAKDQVTTIVAQTAQIQAKYIADSTIAQKNLNDANNTLQAAQKTAINSEAAVIANNAAREKLEKQLMLWCGVAAALCLAGGIFSPIGKGGLIVMALAFGGAAAAIPFIEPWMIIAAGSVILLSVVGYMLYKHFIADKTNTNLINAIEDTKQDPSASLTTLLNNIKQWNTVYVKGASGSIVTKTDQAVENYIAKKLAEFGRLAPTTGSTPTPAPTFTPTPTPTIALVSPVSGSIS